MFAIRLTEDVLTSRAICEFFLNIRNVSSLERAFFRRGDIYSALLNVIFLVRIYI